MVGRRGRRQDMDIGTWERRLFLMCQWFAGTLSLVGRPGMPLICRIDEITYVRHLYVLF